MVGSPSLQEPTASACRSATAAPAVLAGLFGLFLLGSVLNAQPVPDTTLDLDDEVLVGESAQLRVIFDNASGDSLDVGFGPFVDLVLPRNGVDGAQGQDTPDGLSFVSASYLGAELSVTSLLFPDDGSLGSGTGCVDHPLARDTAGLAIRICGDSGDELVVIELPFGSFVPSQPRLEVDLSVDVSALADVNVPLAIRHRSGFRFGADALDNFCCDPTILSTADPDSETWPSASTEPVLFRLSKHYLGPEDETATGPNFPQRYALRLDLADGQDVTDLDLTDTFPTNVAFLSVVSNTPAADVAEAPPVGIAAQVDDRELVVNFPAVNGSMDTVDAEIVVEFFVPLLDAAGQEVLPPTSGDDRISENNLSAIGDWIPIDPRDPATAGNVASDPAGPEHELSDQSITVQKSVSLAVDQGTSGLSPGDSLEYSLHFQVSDFFAFNKVRLTDILSDGQRFDDQEDVVLSFTQHDVTEELTLSAGNIKLVPDFSPDDAPPNSGTTTLIFWVSSELEDRGFGGTMLGGCIPPAGIAGPLPDCGAFNQGGTQGVLRFRTIVLEDFSDDFLSGDPSVDQNDVLYNSVVIGGDVLRLDLLTSNGFDEDDDSSASSRLALGELSKTIYAINGSTTLPDPLEVKPGDTVTYRLQHTLPSLDFESLVIRDYLPLPVHSASEVTASSETVGAAPPPAGTVSLGPLDTFLDRAGFTPQPAVDADSNRIEFDFGTLDQVAAQDAVIDLLMTVTVSSEPFADRLLLTNHLQATQSSTGLAPSSREAIVQFTLRQPVIKMTKGTVATDSAAGVFEPATASPVPFAAPPNAGEPFTAPITSNALAADPVDSDLSTVDAGDLVTFAIVLENSGGSGAFDLVVRDAIPAGLGIPSGGLHLTVRRGDGTALIPIFLGPSLGPSDLFANGLEIADPGGEAACQKFDAESGENVVVITYELEITDAGAAPAAVLANGASLESFTGEDGSSSSHLAGPGPIVDSAIVTIASSTIVKELISTSEPHTVESGAQWPVAVGEELHYRVTVTVPEGVDESVRLIDRLDAGLAVVSVDGLTPSSGLATDQPGGFQGVVDNAVISPDGRDLTFEFGTLTNANRDNGVAETVVFDYTVRVDDQAAIVQEVRRNNRADWHGQNGFVRDRAGDVRVVESVLTVEKSASPASADAGDTVTFTILIDHDPSSQTDAFDLAVEDLLTETDLSLVAGSVSSDRGTIVTGNGGGDETVRLELETLALGDSVTLSFDAQVADQVLSGSTLENSAGLIWDSLPADAAAGERSYGPLVDTASIAIDVPSLAKTVVETSEPSTGTASFDGAIEDLTIGELVVFEIVATVPEGTTAQVVIRDSLPAMAAGLLEATSAEVISVGTNLTAANPAPAPVFEDLNLKDGLFDTVSFDFGQVSNAPDMEVDAGDRLVVRITARAVDADANGSGDLLTNTALLDFSGSLQPSADASVEVVEPLLSLDKSADATTGDAGDSVVFTLTLEHQPGSSADAFDVELRDVIPAGMTLLGGTAVDTGSTPADHLSEGSTLVARWDHFPVGSVGRIEFTVTIDDEVQPGQLINNLGELFWDSLPEDNAATERDGTAGDGHDFMVTDPGVVKTVIQTSEASTGSAVNGPETDLTLGETVTYEIVVTLPEGTTEAATVVDQLPTGDGVLALVSSRVLALGGQLDGPGLPAIGAAGSAADSDLDGHDDRVTWTLGNILNAPDGELDDGDRLRFEVVAVVVDEAVNQGGQDDDASNLATFGHAGGTSLDTALVDLVEPLLALTKGADQEFVDAGDALRYTLRLEHLPTSTADAFSLVVTDPLPAGVDWISTDEVTTDCAGLAVDDAAEPTLAFSLASLSLADGSCEIEFNVTVADTVQPTESLINNAQLQYDSQAVFTAGETRRSTADDNAEVTVLAPGLVKIITDTSLDATGSSFHDALEDDLAIGESIDYRLTAIFPEGQTLNAVVVDALPAGAAGLLEVIGASIVSVGDQIVTELPGTPVLSDDELADGLDDTVTFDFGTVTNAPDGFSDEHDRIVVSVTARVVDDAVNQDGRTLRNEAELRFASGPPLTDSVDAEVVEPDVVVSKTLGPVDDHVATVSIEIRNDGTAPAYDLQVEDVVDAEGWVPAEIVSVGVPAGFVLSSAPGPAPGDVRLTLSSDPGASPPMNSLEPGEAVIWSFTVPVRITDPPQASVDNTAANTVTTTLPGDVPGEREEPQGEDTAVLGLPILAVEKTAELIDDADASGTASPGDTLRYSVSLINTGDGAATDVSVVDVPDANGSLVVGTVVVSAGGAVVEGNGAGEESVAVTFAAVGAGQTATVSYQVLIEPLPIDVEALFNQAQVGLREEADDLVSDDPATASPDDPTEVAVEAAPDLRLMKSAGGAAEPGALLLYTLDYSNAGGQDAVGVEIEETVPAHSSFDAASSLPSVWSCADGSGPGTQCVLTVGALAAGGSGQASFAVHIAAGLPAGADTLDNVAEIRDDLSQGADLNPVDNVAELQTALGAEPAFNFTKSTSAVVAIPGVPLVFDLAYSNVGDQDATGVVLEETVPALTTFDAASSLPTVWSCADGSGPGTVCTVAIGALATGGSGDARFGVIPAGAAGDGQTVSNTAVIRDDGANSEDPVSAQQSAARPIKTLTLTKTRLSGAAVTVGQEVTYRIVARIPEGLSLGAVEIREDLPGQLWALRQDFGQALPGISLTGSTDPVNTGVALVWELGDVSNLDTDAGTDEVIESTYTTVMRNVASAVRGENVRNTVVITADGAELATASADVAVVEPGLTLRKDFAPGVAAAGDTVTVRLRIAHDSSSFVSAYDVEVIDVLDPALTYLGNVQAENGPLPTVDISQLPVVRLEWPELSNVAYHPNNPVIVTFDVQTSSSGRVDNVADLVWTSLAGDPGLADPEEQTTGERSGDSAAAGGGANTYRYRDADQLNNQLIYGFEDLKNDDTLFNDFDYNDWLLKVSLQETLDDDGNWRRLEFVVEGLGRGAGFNHLPFLDIGIEGPVSYTLSRFNSAGTLIFEQTRTSDGDFLRDVQLFADTWDTLPPWNLGNFPFAANTDPAQTSGLVTAGQTARLVVEVGEPERNPRIADDVVTVHLNETFNHLVGPWIDVLDTGERIAFRWRGSGATQDLVTADLYGPTTPLLGFPLDQGRAFEAVWRWPVEREPIWDAYPSFVDFILSGETQSTDWRLQPSAGLIWPVDVPPEAAAPVDAPNSGQACGAVAFDHAYGSPVSASPAIGDLDGDGDWEVVSAEFLGAVVIHDESGGTVRVIEPGSGVNGQSSASVTLADLDGDSDLEILRGYDDGHLIAFHHDGTEARRWWLPGSLKSTAAVGDLDGDGDLEIVVLAGDTKLYGLQAEGGEMAGFPVEIGGLEDISNNFVLQPSPAVADVVPGGDLEVVAVNNLGVVHVLTADGGAVAGWPHDLGVATLASPAVADLDGGGGLEILVADDGGGLSALDAGGQLLWHVQRVLGGPSSPALGDLDGAGGLEVVVGSMDGKVYAFDASGQAVPGWPVSTGSAVLGSPALGDVDGDGAAEVFIGSFDTSVHAWRGDAQVIPGFGDTAFPCSVGAAIFSSPALGDIDQDTHVEVLLGSYSRQLFRATAAGSVAAGSVPWPEFRGGGGHQGATGAGLMPRLPTDLSLSLTDGVDEVLPGQDVAYKLAIQNVGPNAADGAELTLEVGPNLSECTWTCASLPGGLCPSGAGVGSIDLRVDLPVNGRLGFEVDCRVVDEVVGDQVVVHAAIGIPADRFDLDTSDNQAVDVNLNAGGLIFADGFEGGDTLRWSSTVEDP